MLCARPMPASSIPPHHTGMPCACANAWISFASPYPPTRPSLILMIRHAPNSCACCDGREADDGFIETDRGVEATLQLGMVDEIAGRQRLLDHQEIELVESREERSVGHERVCRIGVDRERDVRKLPTDRFDQLHVLARLDFDLDPLVAALDLPADFVEERLRRFLQADGHAARDFCLRAADMSPQGLFSQLRFEIPDGRLDPGLRHPVFPNRGKRVAHLRRGL